MKILIIKPSSLGDIIHALPFLKAVKDTFPDSSVDWVISKSLKDILNGNPLINELIVIDKDSWKDIRNLKRTSREIYNLKKTLKGKHYDMVIDLQGLLRSGIISLFAPSSLKIGFANAREGSRYIYDRRVSVNGISHAVDKNLEVARAIQKDQKPEVESQKSEKTEFPLYIGNTAKENVKRILGKVKEKEYVVIVPSARWKTKRWPLENFGMLISKLSTPCVITGGSADREIVQQIIASSGGKGINLCGKTDLKELSALIAGARVVISSDSGPMHIAVALKVPVIALFGPTDPLRTGPYGWQDNKDLIVMKSDAPCSPCFKKRCKDPFCMTDISVDTVLRELKKYL